MAKYMGHRQKIEAYLEVHQAQMIQLLEQLVCIQSGSHNKKGVDTVGQLIQKTMEAIGFSCESETQKKWGHHIIARSPHFDNSKKQILITGHMDTVFPEDTAFNYFKQNGDTCYGPGVADMKGGLVVGIFALKALFNCAVQESLPPITFIFNSDEEVGSPSSRELIRKEAQNARMAFVLEAGGLNNEVVTGRKGNISVGLTIQGQAGHAAFAEKNKASAVLELAHKTIAIENLNCPEKGISANVGLINGGIGPNSIPEHAHARIDFRFINPNDFKPLRQQAQSICQTTQIPGTRSNMEIISSRPAMPQTQQNTALFEQAAAVAQRLGMVIKPELRQGVSDANIIAGQGIPVIDGLGPVGAKDHSSDEYIITQSLFDRTRLFANILASAEEYS